MFKSFLHSIFSEAFKLSEKSVSKVRVSEKADRKIIGIFLLVLISLVLNRYFGNLPRLGYTLDMWYLHNSSAKIRLWSASFENPQLIKLVYWAMFAFVTYFVLPYLYIKLLLKESLVDYGIGFKGALAGKKVYFWLFAMMLPIIFAASYSLAFQKKYPFYQLSPGECLYPNFMVWHVFYLLQFFALEFFYRGFMVHGLKVRFGFYSIFVMTIPYCMIHFDKPFPEALGAIVAGIVLGSMSLKSSSIWLGVAIHYSVAITMDLCSLYQKGLL